MFFLKKTGSFFWVVFIQQLYHPPSGCLCGSGVCQLWSDRISARNCPQFPNGLVQFLIFLAGIRVIVNVTGYAMCIVNKKKFCGHFSSYVQTVAIWISLMWCFHGRLLISVYRFVLSVLNQVAFTATEDLRSCQQIWRIFGIRQCIYQPNKRLSRKRELNSSVIISLCGK